MSERLVIIGNGMAAARLVEEIGKLGLGRYAILVIGAEPTLAYNRVLLSSLLAGEVARDDMVLKGCDWWRAQGVTLLYGEGATSIDTTAKTVALESGKLIAFDRLVIATGSTPIRLPKPGMDLPGVLTFRDHDDVSAMLDATSPETRAVVIGGGLLGIEAAHGLSKTGARVTLIHLMDRLMERQLDSEAAALLRRELQARGIEIILGADTAAVEGDACVEAVRLADGRVLQADMVVAAVGIRPNAELARAAGLTVNRGILVDDGLATSDPDISALGECAEHRGTCYGLVEPAYDQAKVLAARLCGLTAAYAGTVLATNLKVSGVPVFSAGDFIGAQGTEAIIYRDPGLGTYRKLVLRGDVPVGTVLVGETSDGLWYLDLIRRGEKLGPLRDAIVFGRSFAEAA
jgi:nitrite reductase (NADH) large subunit